MTVEDWLRIEGETVWRISKEYGVVIHLEQKNQNGSGRNPVLIVYEKGRTKAVKDDIISTISERKRV